MTFLCIWKVFLIGLWMPFDFMPLMHCSAEADHILLKQDVVLINDRENPKCFTRTRRDFTCFFETTENRTYDFLYSSDSNQDKKCGMSIHGTENGTFLHVCSFPKNDVFLYSETKIKVTDRTTNTSLYNRTVFVEDLCFLDPPFNVSLQPSENVGQFKVSLKTVRSNYIPEKKYRIRYSSMTLGEKTVEKTTESFQLELVPGEEVVVQASVKCASDPDQHPGYWSAWSKPAVARVPMVADESSLVCFTSDLQHVTCQWNSTEYAAENEYKLFYKLSLRPSSSWTEWRECQEDGNVSGTCSFEGDKFGKMKVKLNSTAAADGPVIFSKEFALNKTIKSAPPSHLKGTTIKEKLCLEWEAPLPSVSSHLEYEMFIQFKGGNQWRNTIAGSNSACLDFPAGCQFSVKIRAKPDGLIYSGYWSDWSDVFSSATPQDTGMLIIWCICVSLLILVISFIITFFLHYRKLKQYFWPPVPNLEKVLQGFLIDINQQKWGPPVTAKLCFEETTSSVVEIMSDDEISGLNKPSEPPFDHLSSDGSSSTTEQAEGSCGSEAVREYVTLNKDLTLLCLKENCYVFEQFEAGKSLEAGNELLKTCRCLKRCSCNTYFNHSYLPLAKFTDDLNHNNVTDEKGARNPYSNLPFS